MRCAELNSHMGGMNDKVEHEESILVQNSAGGSTLTQEYSNSGTAMRRSRTRSVARRRVSRVWNRMAGVRQARRQGHFVWATRGSQILIGVAVLRDGETPLLTAESAAKEFDDSSAERDF
jgi:hypothetical protein